jgi:hypothetical protein
MPPTFKRDIRWSGRSAITHQITLTDDDYAALTAAASRTGDTIEALVHRVIAEHVAQASQPRQIGSYQYPTGEPISDEEEAEEEQLAQEFGSDKPWLSDMIIEDRGPR